MAIKYFDRFLISKNYKTYTQMTKYLSVVILILLFSCKQANGNLETKKDSIQSSEDKTAMIDEKIDYDSIWTEANEKVDSEFSENFDSISNSFEEFIPNGFSVKSFSSGDANSDGLSDTILIVKKDGDIYDFGTLILLLKQNDESYKLALKNNDIFGGDNNTVKIDNGRIFIIENYNAGVDISFFKFDKTKENWILVEKFSSGLDGKGDATKAEEIVTLDK